MNVNGDINQRCFEPWLEPLFQAMLTGQPVASITYMTGQINKDDPAKDVTIENVVATDYWQGIGSSYDQQTSQYVKTDYVDATPRGFYMGWIRSFII